jgi:hypothetical protein
MSVQAFKRSFTNPLLKKLDKERRIAIEGQRGQLIILQDIKAFIMVIETSYPEIKIPASAAEKALKEGRSKAESLQRGFRDRNKTRYNAIVSKFPKVYGTNYMIGKDAFIVNSFKGSINIIKNAILKSLESQGFISAEQKAETKSKIHKGHGVIGGAVSEVQIAASLAAVNKEQYELLENNIQAFFKKAEIPMIRQRQIIGLMTKYNMVVTKKGDLKADYFSTVTFQVGAENTGVDAQSEKEVKSIFKNFIENLPNIAKIEGSSTLEEKIEKVIVDAFISKLDKSKVKVSVNQKIKNAKLKTKGLAAVKVAPEKPRVKVVAGGTLKKGKLRVTPAAFSFTSLIGILNAQLPGVVTKNMNLPGLENRTGRFAGSVRVTDISQTARGFPSVGYTYDTFPYQTFEPGYAQGSVDRDPRKVINLSIREIAAQYAIGRFYTRRV